MRHFKICISCRPNLNVNFVLGVQSGPAKVTTAITKKTKRSIKG